MNRYLAIVNARTALAVGISLVTSYITLSKQFQYNFDLALISIAIIFPLVFTIRSAFRRREKALEYLAQFKASLITVNNCFQENRKLEEPKKLEVEQKIKHISICLVDFLGPKTSTKEAIYEQIQSINLFMRANSDLLGNGTNLKIFRFLKDVNESVENIISINQYRTPISMRAYCLIFIYLYPVIYTPALYNKLHDGVSFNESWIVYALSLVSTFILISLYNVQSQMENPFDQEGLDDINLNQFRLS